MGHDDSATPAGKRPERTCAGCNKHAPAEGLVRVVHDPSSGGIAVDLASSSFGRGGHVHASLDCLKKAAKSGFARTFKAEVKTDAQKLGEDIVVAADRRIEGLLAGARRANQLVYGADAVVEAGRKEELALVVVAVDAASAAKLSEVQRAISEGRAIAWNNKSRLGQLLSKEEVAVIGVLHPGVAETVSRTYRFSGPFRSTQAWSSSSEVR